MKSIGLGFLVSFLFLFLSACSDGNHLKDPKNTDSDPISWESIAKEFNPREEQFQSDITGVQKISLNLLSSKTDIRVVYSRDIQPGQLFLQLFTVSKNARYPLSGAYFKKHSEKMTISSAGSNYQCKIRTRNKIITELEGSCYIRVVLTLPVNSEIEVFDQGRLLTRRFFAMDNESFLNALDDARHNEKLAVIDAYLASYGAVRKTPSLTCKELDQVLNEVARGEEQLKALSQLHLYVTDRENLPKLIDDEISYFERERARRIVGLK